jgi:hypothetical protein
MLFIIISTILRTWLYLKLFATKCNSFKTVFYFMLYTDYSLKSDSISLSLHSSIYNYSNFLFSYIAYKIAFIPSLPILFPIHSNSFIDLFNYNIYPKLIPPSVKN